MSFNQPRIVFWDELDNSENSPAESPSHLPTPRPNQAQVGGLRGGWRVSAAGTASLLPSWLLFKISFSNHVSLKPRRWHQPLPYRRGRDSSHPPVCPIQPERIKTPCD